MDSERAILDLAERVERAAVALVFVALGLFAIAAVLGIVGLAIWSSM